MVTTLKAYIYKSILIYPDIIRAYGNFKENYNTADFENDCFS